MVAVVNPHEIKLAATGAHLDLSTNNVRHVCTPA